jgi:hypothetical protein
MTFTPQGTRIKVFAVGALPVNRLFLLQEIFFSRFKKNQKENHNM